MRNQLFLYLRLSVLVLFVCVTPMQSQKTASTQEQVIENKIRLNELEKKVDAQDKEMHHIYDKKQVELESKFELKNENLESKSTWVNYLLGILGILIAFFGIGVPFAAVYYSRKYSSEIDSEVEKANNDLETFKSDFRHALDQLIKLKI